MLAKCEVYSVSMEVKLNLNVYCRGPYLMLKVLYDQYPGYKLFLGTSMDQILPRLRASEGQVSFSYKMVICRLSLRGKTTKYGKVQKKKDLKSKQTKFFF